jgi:TPR repeat protein
MRSISFAGLITAVMIHSAAAQPYGTFEQMPLWTNNFYQIEENFQSILQNAQNGNVNSQTSLAGLYLWGMNVKRDEHKAAHWYRKAAEQGSGHGLFGLGYLHSIGEGGLKKNDAKAFNYFMQATRNRFPYANMWIAEFYRDGRGVKQDKEQAFRWFAAACVGSEDEAANALAGRPTEELKQMADKLMQIPLSDIGIKITCDELS